MTTQNRYSPTPWKAETDLILNATITEIFDANGDRIATLDNCERVQENAELMEAAPTLLAACRSALELFSGVEQPFSKFDQAVWDALQAAIAKAEGQS